MISHADAAAKLLQNMALCLQSTWVFRKRIRQIKIDRQAQADRQIDSQAEPLCAVVLTTEQEQHPGPWNECGWRMRRGEQKKHCVNPIKSIQHS